jgi:hypothetical protein
LRKAVLTLVSVVALTAGVVGPAWANNDPRAPADECSPSPNAIGHPNDPFGANNGVDVLEARTGAEMQNPVDAPASSNPNNPGESDGAQGQARSEAPDHCANAP